ncbi:MAG: hypothetical protein PWP24_364 [Clostridiales bacterium]|nr:hypothetical protein [Clostridiales bacterium]
MGIKQILIVEDDKKLSRGLELALKHEALRIVTCFDLETARKQLSLVRFDLVLLDINLPDGSGITLLNEIKTAGNLPAVILLTANDTEMDIVAGLECGADDYITKPFSLAILRARVHAQLRQAASYAATYYEVRPYIKGAYQFDFIKMEFLYRGQSVVLSKTEQKLLYLLIENRGTTLARAVLMDRIWGDGSAFVEENALSVTVKRLRDKLMADSYIKTIYGIGYAWKEPSDE